ncbi:MAG: O-antigen ligase family protein [Planctomycetes bacterium]|nr:O-antigen ligase family protein [Planctomycetota bacterium]
MIRDDLRVLFGSPARALRRVPLLAASLTVFWPPLAYGAVHPPYASLLGIAGAVVLALWPFAILAPSDRPASRRRRSRKKRGDTGRPAARQPRPWPRALAVAGGLFLLGWSGLQLLPLPLSVLSTLSPAAGEIHASARAVLPSEEVGSDLATASLAPGRTRGALCGLAASLAVLAALATAVRRRREAVFVVAVIVLAAVFCSVYGLVQARIGSDEVWGHEKEHYRESVTGTYVNRNHFAALLALSLPLAMTMVLATRRRGALPDRSWRDALTAALSDRRTLSLRALWGTAVLVLGLGLFASQSRLGVSAAAVGGLFLIFFYLGRRSRRLYGIALAVLVAAVLFLVFWVGFVDVTGRFGKLASGEASEADRIAVWRATLAIIADHPLLGTGLGTFGDVFAAYRPATVSNPYDHAHNDYLNLASDLGLPGLAAAGALFAGAVAAAARGLAAKDRFRRDLAAGVLASLAVAATLSVADFNLQIPANGMALAALLGLAFSLDRLRRGWEREAGAEKSVRRRARFALALVALAGATLLFRESYRFRRAAVERPYVLYSLPFPEKADFEARLSVGSEEGRQREIERAVSGFEGVLEWTPDDGWSLGELAELQLRAGAGDGEARRLALAPAARAVRSEPTVAAHHARLGALLYSERDVDRADRAWALARRFGPSEPHILRLVGAYELRRYSEGAGRDRLERGLEAWRRAGAVLPERDLEELLEEAWAVFPDPTRVLAIVPRSERCLYVAYRFFRRKKHGLLALTVGRSLPAGSDAFQRELAELYLEAGDARGAARAWRDGIVLAADPFAHFEAAFEPARTAGALDEFYEVVAESEAPATREIHLAYFRALEAYRDGRLSECVRRLEAVPGGRDSEPLARLLDDARARIRDRGR